ncbi:MAG: hypothetical protein JSS48_15805 [Nitrospira sp.]|nr:hypothetical protein [Nitrospira sp.]
MDTVMILACCAQVPQKQTVANRVRFVCLKCGRGQEGKYRKSETAAARAWEVDPAPWDGPASPIVTKPVSPDS